MENARQRTVLLRLSRVKLSDAQPRDFLENSLRALGFSSDISQTHGAESLLDEMVTPFLFRSPLSFSRKKRCLKYSR